MLLDLDHAFALYPTPYLKDRLDEINSYDSSKQFFQTFIQNAATYSRQILASLTQLRLEILLR